MTPKEKAQELFDKMHFADDPWDYPMCFETAKQCALIAVDEIIKVASLIKVGLELDYWEQVKNEIENL